ncbi:uncharacterized protein H6S33_009373 [Morchella sextelata]|uniref:uncharacterized protein n=1 Tax=Morchella sextelata TaxID=1174677 RepID=UPI001D04A0E9|nr:uncharacterized protein H6S33_009373 [Morchella sextelata]KAH0612993.1 hypothetical protein H6S33_009373 [Morchella sextelata]
MPAIMHPRSFSTAAVFATTFILSFTLVSVDHLLHGPTRAQNHVNRVEHGTARIKDDVRIIDRGQTLLIP